jgi:hypothetical protein
VTGRLNAVTGEQVREVVARQTRFPGNVPSHPVYQPFFFSFYLRVCVCVCGGRVAKLPSVAAAETYPALTLSSFPSYTGTVAGLSKMSSHSFPVAQWKARLFVSLSPVVQAS